MSESPRNSNPIFTTAPENYRTRKQLEAAEAESRMSDLEGEDLRSPETKHTSQLASVKRIPW